MSKKLREILKLLANKIDMQDLFAFGGLALVCYGAAQIYPPASWIIGGGVLMAIGLRS